MDFICGHCANVCNSEISCEKCTNDYYCTIKCRDENKYTHELICGTDLTTYNTRVQALVDKIARDNDSLSKILSNKKHLGVIIYAGDEHKWYPLNIKTIRLIKNSYEDFQNWDIAFNVLMRIRKLENLQYFIDVTYATLVSTCCERIVS